MSAESPLLHHKPSYKSFDEFREQASDDKWNRRLDQLKGIHWSKRPSVVYVGIAAFIYTFSIVGEPVRQIILFKLACNSLIVGGDSDQCNAVDTQIMVSNYGQLQLVVSQLALMVALANFGWLSDAFGRKLFMGIIVLSVIISRIILYVEFVYSPLFNVKVFLICDTVGCCMGGVFAMMGLVGSYVADISRPDHREYLMGFIQGCLFAGEMVGPLVSNFVLDFVGEQHHVFSEIETKEFLPLKIELLTFMVLMVYIIFVLPESRFYYKEEEEEEQEEEGEYFSIDEVVQGEIQQNRDQNSQDQSQNHSKNHHNNPSLLSRLNIFKPLALFIHPPVQGDPQRKTRKTLVIYCLVISNCITVAFAVGMARIIFQYCIYKFNFTSDNVAQLMSLFASSRVLASFLLIPLLANKLLPYFNFDSFKTRIDSIGVTMVMIGLISDGLYYFGVASSETSFQVMGSVVIGSLSAMIMPTCQANLIKYYPEELISELLMAINLLNGLVCLVAPVITTSIYKIGLNNDIEYLPFMVCSIVDVFLFGLYMFIKRLG